LQPVYNRQLRRERQLLTWKLAQDPSARPLVVLTRMDDVGPQDFPQLYGTYRSKRQATESLRLLAQMHQLCTRALGLESGKGACFAHQIGKCKGVCVGKEAPERHYLRVQMALAQHRLRSWPYPGPIGIREYHAQTSRTETHLFDQWCHLATVRDEAELDDALRSRQVIAFDLDTYRLLGQRLGKVSAQDQAFIHLYQT
jgi:DNA polymerase III subunit epsilon